MNYKLNHDYQFATKMNMPLRAQQIFWKDVVGYPSFEEITDAYDYQGYGFDGVGDGSESFTLNLNDQYVAEYSYYFPGHEDVFEISIGRKNSNVYKGFVFYVNKGNFRIIKDDSKHRIKGSISPEERIRIDKQTTPENITNTDKLEKLAIQRFKETQEDYYSKAN